MSDFLRTLYASAPKNFTLINTIEIIQPAIATIRISNQYEDLEFTLEDSNEYLFLGRGVDIQLPDKDTKGNQTVNLVVSNIDGTAQNAIITSLNDGSPAQVIFREFAYPDLSAPVSRIDLTIVGATLDKQYAAFQCQAYDILNTAWPRLRYTAQNAPGLRWS